MDHQISQCPRAQMADFLPSVLQPALTWLTGKALVNQPASEHTPLYHVLTAVSASGLGISISAMAVLQSTKSFYSLLFLPLGWLLTVSGFRKLQLMIIHQCAHDTFSRSKRVNRFVGELLSSILFVENFDSYRANHLGAHHSKKHMTCEDPTVRFVVHHLRPQPNDSKCTLRRKLVKTLVSPKYHYEFFASRLSSQLKARGVWKYIGTAFWVGLTTAAIFCGGGKICIVGILTPLFIVYPLSSFLRLCVEHRWPSGSRSDHARAIQSDYSVGIFLGECPPIKNGTIRILPLFGWTMRMIFNHLFFRLFVMVGDTPCHDFHHRYPAWRNWMNYSYARAHDLASGHRGWPEYKECWGFLNALDQSLESISMHFSEVNHAQSG